MAGQKASVTLELVSQFATTVSSGDVILLKLDRPFSADRKARILEDLSAVLPDGVKVAFICDATPFVIKEVR